MKTFDSPKSKEQVRQGSDRQMNLRVLIISLSIIVVVFGFVYFYFFHEAPPISQQL